MGIKKRLRCALTLASLTGLLSACSPAPVQDPLPAPAAAEAFLDPYVAHQDERLGLPTFIWLTPRTTEPAGKDAKDVAWRVLRELAPTYKMSAIAMQSVQQKNVHDLGRGAILVKFEQQVDGLEVFLRGVTVALDQTLRPVAATGNFAPTVRRTAADFSRPPSDAITAALQHVIGGSLPVGPVTTSAQKGRYTQFAVAPVQLGNQSYTLAAPARTKQILFPAAHGLIPAYYVELSVRADDGAVRWLSAVISATDNSVLFTKDLTANESYSYRVWADDSGKFTPHVGPYGDSYLPHPTGKPDGSRPLVPLPQNLVSLPNVPFSQNDPWLPAGASEARGNNAWAYADISNPDGFANGDVALPPSSPGAFDYSADPEAASTTSDAARRAAITQLFYTINYMHDDFYDAGWDEKSGNPQQSNYGRGGLEGDAFHAESQDYISLNNANCSTPADGSSPRIQMFLWNNPALLTALSPADLAKMYSLGSADYGPQSFSLTANLVVVNDGAGAATSDGCETPFTNAAAVAGKIAVIDRGTCGFSAKTKNAQLAGAVGAIIVNNVIGAAPGMTGSDPTITIPTVSLSLADGTLIKNRLAGGTPVQVTLARSALLREGSFDNGVIAHEWGHALSNRLIGNASGISTNQSAGLGEGWSDFVALLTLVRPAAALAPANANWNGTFAVGTFDLNLFPDSYYYGIRRYPYSADMTKNPLTYKYISKGVVLPTVPSPNFGNDGVDNAEVHNTGEVWASMLWDCYVNMLRDTGRYSVADAQKVMREYLVASLKLTPMAPTLLEARDALLATMYARDSKDFAACAASFARRKAGVGAVAPDRYDDFNIGAVESGASGPDIALVSYKLSDVTQSCDNDGIIDNGETGRLSIVVRNTGTAPLTDATITVTANNQYVVFANGGKVSVPAMQPFASATAQVEFQLKGAPGILTSTLHVAATAPSLAVPRTVAADILRRMNYDVAVGAATTDAFGVIANLGWSVMADTSLPGAADVWRQAIDEMGAGLFGVLDSDSRADQYLVSPPIAVSATTNFGFTMRHRYSFEFDAAYNYDGGVVEISQDNGFTWTDIGNKFTAGGYAGSVGVVTEETPDLRNPLLDPRNPVPRPAFIRQSAGVPAFTNSTVDLGRDYAGKVVRLRFRVGSDAASGDAGWQISQISLTGATNKPFAQAVVQRAQCMNQPPAVTVTPTEQSLPAGQMATLTGTVADPDGDTVVYEWVQLSGPVVPILDPTALLQTFTVPTIKETVDATFVLRASDGKAKTEVVATVTFYAPGSASGSGSSDGASTGCGCRTVPVKTRATDLAWDFLWVALAGLYCHRRRFVR